jgi:hypothetical protein
MLSATLFGQTAPDKPKPTAEKPSVNTPKVPLTATKAKTVVSKPVVEAPKPMSAQRSEDIKKTIAKKKAREIEVAAARAKKKAGQAKAFADEQAYIDKMMPFWTALQIEQAKLNLQQQRNAILASEAESLQRSTKASEKIAQAIYYRSGAPMVLDPTTGQMIPYGVPR